MTDLVGTDLRIPSEEILVRLLQIGVVIEEYAEEKSAVMTGRATRDEYLQEILFDSRDESQEHRDRLVELIEGVGSEVDKGNIEERVRETIEASVDGINTDEQALREQLKSERLAYSFYDRLIEACENSSDMDLDDDEFDRVVSVLRDIREDEAEDARKIENILKGAT